MRGRVSWGRSVRRGAAVLTALAVSAVGAVSAVPTTAEADPAEATPLSVPGMAVSLAQAGELALWGDNTYDRATVPASLSGVAVSQVVFPPLATLALTADGLVVGWGASADRLERVPAAVAATKVAQIATQTGYAGAVTRDGRVMTWGRKKSYTTTLDVPPGLSGVKQLALTDNAAAALKSDGSVVAWGEALYGQTAVPAGLKATAIAATAQYFIALTEQGTVVAWGNLTPFQQGMPDSLEEPGNVKAVAASYQGAVALLADNSVVTFGWSGEEPLPTEIADADPVLLANSGADLAWAIVDRDRTIRTWSRLGWAGEVPAALNGRPITQIVLGPRDPINFQIAGGVIITKLLRAELPQVTGAAQVGSVVTGVPGTFSAAPDSVVSEWLVDGSPAGSGAQLAVSAAMAGKSISYRSTASKAGQATVVSTSAAVTVANPAPPAPAAKVASKTTVGKVTVAKKAKVVTVAGKVTASKSPAGKATVTIKKGKKTIVTKSVAVSAAGALKLSVKKFATLVAKKLKAKGKKAKTAYRGKYAVTISYAGNAQVTGSAASGKLTIKK